MEAFWRIMGYATYPSCFPTVHSTKVKSAEQMHVMKMRKKLSEFAIYMMRPRRFANMKMTEFYQIFQYGSRRPDRYNYEQYAIDVSSINPDNPTVYIYRLKKPREVVRLSTVAWDAGEIWWLRLLTKERPIIGTMSQAKMVNGIQCSTFQEACREYGLLAEENEAEICLRDALNEGISIYEICRLFVQFTIEGYATLKFFNTKIHNLVDLFHDSNREFFLRHLQSLFLDAGKSMKRYGLPEPLGEAPTMLDEYKRKFSVTDSNVSLQLLTQEHPNTLEMSNLFNDISNALDNQNENDQVKFFAIDSMGGSGKSMFARKVFHYVRSQNKIAYGTASTALAAQLYGHEYGFETCHTGFAIPVRDDDEDYECIGELKCDTQRNPDRTNFLKSVDLFIIDEAFSLNKYNYMAIMQSYNNLKGKIVLFLMDRGQTSPVVKFGERNDIVDSTMLRLPWWNEIRRYEFSVNLRLHGLQDGDPDDRFVQSQRRYADQLVKIRTNGPYDVNDDIVELDNNDETGTKYLMYKGYQKFTNEDDALTWLYNGDVVNDDINKKAILCSLNSNVDKWNKKVQELNPSPLYTLKSDNTLVDCDDPHGYLQNMLTEHSLNFYNKPGVPLHELTLKVGDICFLMRNLSV